MADLNLNRVSHRGLLLLLEAREEGYLAGYLDGAQAERDSIARAAVDVVGRMAQIPPRDELEELRGNPAGAERIRKQWRSTGLLGGAA